MLHPCHIAGAASARCRDNALGATDGVVDVELVVHAILVRGNAGRFLEVCPRLDVECDVIHPLIVASDESLKSEELVDAAGSIRTTLTYGVGAASCIA